MMKARFIYVVMAAALILAAAAGDSPAKNKWQAGFKGGVNSSQFYGDPVAPWVYAPSQGYELNGDVGDRITGAVVGVFFRRTFADWFGLQVATQYSQKGGNGTVWGTYVVPSQSVGSSPTVADVSGTMEIHMDYVEIPILAAFMFPSANRVGFTVFLGPSIGYNTRAEAELKGTATEALPNNSNKVYDFDTTMSISGEINRWEVAGIVGSGLEFEMSKSVFVLDVRYQFGVTSIDGSNSKNIYNHVFSITLDFMAPFGL
jgi:hypothetical protein